MRRRKEGDSERDKKKMFEKRVYVCGVFVNEGFLGLLVKMNSQGTL